MDEWLGHLGVALVFGPLVPVAAGLATVQGCAVPGVLVALAVANPLVAVAVAVAQPPPLRELGAGWLVLTGVPAVLVLVAACG